MRSPNIRYIEGVDHLRGIAAIWVLVYHGLQVFRAHEFGDSLSRAALWIHTRNPLAALIIEGHTAVALFMVLSGFIFTYGNRDDGIIWTKFVRNRLLRIAPLVIVLIVAGTYAFPQSFRFEGFWQHVFLQSNLPGATPMGPFNLMFWTIAVEFQFYLIFPFLLHFLRSRGPRYAAGLIALALALRGLAVIHGANPRDLSYWTIVGRIDQFVAGMVLGYVYRPGFLHNGRRLVAAGCAACLAVAGMIYAFHRAGGNPEVAAWKVAWPTVESIVWASFIGFYLEASPRIWPRLSRGLCGLGSLSFSIYLIHRIVIDGMTKRDWMIPTTVVAGSWNAAINMAAIAIPATLALSYLTYHIVEKPFLELRGSYKRPTAKSTETTLRIAA